MALHIATFAFAYWLWEWLCRGKKVKRRGEEVCCTYVCMCVCINSTKQELSGTLLGIWLWKVWVSPLPSLAPEFNKWRNSLWMGEGRTAEWLWRTFLHEIHTPSCCMYYANRTSGGVDFTSLQISCHWCLSGLHCFLLIHHPHHRTQSQGRPMSSPAMALQKSWMSQTNVAMDFLWPIMGHILASNSFLSLHKRNGNGTDPPHEEMRINIEVCFVVS